MGSYVIDFLCEERKLAIELDGGQHTVEKDSARTKWLFDHGIRIVRFWNNDVLTNLPACWRRSERRRERSLKENSRNDRYQL